MRVIPSLPLLVVGSCLFLHNTLGQSSSQSIEYIRQNIPAVELPVSQGQSYEDTVPDTLDIAERAELAINGLTGPTDPQADYEIYWAVNFFHNPPIMTHDQNDWVQLKFFEALPLLRVITGSDHNNQVDPVWQQVVLKSLGPDGLYYFPTRGRPWTRLNLLHFDIPVWRADGSTTNFQDESVAHYSNPFVIARVLNILTVYYLRDGNPIWKEAAQKMIDRSVELAIDKGNYCHFAKGFLEPYAKVDRKAPVVTDLPGADTGGRVIQGCANVYRTMGYAPARQLGAKLVRYMRDHANYFDPAGRFIGDGGTPHFHGHTMILVAMADFAISTDDAELLDFVRRSYEWAKTQGVTLVGFFPEGIRADFPTSEICEVADMIAVALKLSAAGAGDYWDDADRWVRNQFFENQLTETNWVYDRTKTLPKTTVAPNETADRVAERNIGAFAGWSSGNDWALHHGIMHCCTGNATRSIYYIWEHMLNYRDGELRVNLLLNRPSRWADVYSHIPYKGRVDVKIKHACRNVSLRMPEWIPTNSKYISGTVNGKVRPITWNGRYVNLGSAESGDKISVCFSIGARTVAQRIGAVDYTLIVKGNTVVAIEPAGKRCPLYQRDHYRQSQTCWRKVKRFVSEKDIIY